MIFDKVWHRGLLHKLPRYDISGRVFSIENYFSGRSMKDVVIIGFLTPITKQASVKNLFGSNLFCYVLTIFRGTFSDHL